MKTQEGGAPTEPSLKMLYDWRKSIFTPPNESKSLDAMTHIKEVFSNINCRIFSPNTNIMFKLIFNVLCRAMLPDIEIDRFVINDS